MLDALRRLGGRATGRRLADGFPAHTASFLHGWQCFTLRRLGTVDRVRGKKGCEWLRASVVEKVYSNAFFFKSSSWCGGNQSDTEEGIIVTKKSQLCKNSGLQGPP